MKVLKIILIILGALIGLFIIITLLLPSKSHVERTVTINAPINVVYNMFANLKNWERWDYWQELDTNQKREYSKPPVGKGAYYTWSSTNKDVGKGKLTITEAKSPSYLKMELGFGDNKMGSGEVFLSEKDGKTTAKWTMDSDLHFLWKWFGLMMDAMVGPFFEKGLDKMKSYCEKYVNGKYTIEFIDTPEQTILFVKDSSGMKPAEIGAKLGKAYGEIAGFMKKNNVGFAGNPVAITLNDWDGKSWIFNAGMPVAVKYVKTEGRIQLGGIPSGKTIKSVYTGPYEASMPAYEEIMKFITYFKFEIRDKSWEAYPNNPKNTTKDKLITEIYFPVY